jgi:outer membrane immunogenic protein
MKSRLLLSASLIFWGLGTANATSTLPETYDSDWTGLYATLSAGYSNITLEGSQTGFYIISDTEHDKDSSDGLIFGVGTGVNHDFGDFVFGLEGDISLLTNENRLEMKQTVDVDYDWFATGRARAGYDDDGTLYYATGGVALLSADIDGHATTIENEPIPGDHHNEIFVGWTAGGGIEHRVNDALSVRLEALYADFGEEDFDLSGKDTELDADMWLVRFGVSLHL